MSEVKRMYELLYEERWDEKKQKERRNEEAFFHRRVRSPEKFQLKNCLMFLMPEYGRIRRGTIRRRWFIAFLNRSSDVL